MRRSFRAAGSFTGVGKIAVTLQIKQNSHETISYAQEECVSLKPPNSSKGDVTLVNLQRQLAMI